MRRVVVVGGGVSGMTAAYALQWGGRRGGRPRSEPAPERRQFDLLCCEAEYVPGGSVQTVRAGEFLLESGPVGLRDCGPAFQDLIRRLKLESRRVKAAPGAEAYQVFRAGKLRRLPVSAGEFLKSDLLPAKAMLRALAEPLAPRASSGDDESIESFAVRRLGREAGSLLADALATAACAGDSRRLSMRAAFPKLLSMEADHGSLFRALRAAPSDGPHGRLVSFEQGLSELTGALAGRLGDSLRTGVGVCAVSGMGERGLRVVPESGPAFDADAVVLACPAKDAAAIVGEWDPELARLLAGIPTARVARVHLGYREGAKQPWPEGSGFVVPRDQGLRILGAEWASGAYPGRGPAGSRLLTVTLGGTRDPQALGLRDETLVNMAKSDLRQAMGLVADPYVARVVRSPVGLPQYEVGHADRLVQIERLLERQPGLHLCGCSYRSLELGACIDEAARTAETVLQGIRSQSATSRPDPAPVRC